MQVALDILIWANGEQNNSKRMYGWVLVRPLHTYFVFPKMHVVRISLPLVTITVDSCCYQNSDLNV